MPQKIPLDPALRQEYEQLFALAAVRPEHAFEIAALTERIFRPDNWARYQAVAQTTHVPAHVVAIIHCLEAGLDCGKHLHNGDPLTARTVNYPPGRPKDGEPPFAWEVSAADALCRRGLDSWTDWSLAGLAYALEGYNGWGYRLGYPHVKSPYLWSFTTVYTAGKFVADHVFSPTCVSRQAGAMALLKHMLDSGRISLDVPAQSPVDPEATAAPTAEERTDPAPAWTKPPVWSGHHLTLGAKGEEVRLVQARLRECGITEVGGLDGDFGEKTSWAVRLFQARSRDEAGEALAIDGIVGHRTWQALFGPDTAATPKVQPPAPGSLAEAVLAAASGEVGVREVPPGSNRGPRVDQYLESVGPGLAGQPWCMAFVHWCFAQAAGQLGRANPLPRTANVWRGWEIAQQTPGATLVTATQAAVHPERVRPGMVFYLDCGGRTGHAGLVADVTGSRLVTIEGNTNALRGRNGIGVFLHDRRRIERINLGFAAFA